MEKSAKTISLRKFSQLSLTGRHRVLLELAESVLNEGMSLSLEDRYHQLCQSVEMDSFSHSVWLSETEKWQGRAGFHRSFLTRLPERDATCFSIWETRRDIAIVLEGIHSPYNLGSIFRLIDNFGLAGIVTSDSNPSRFHPQCRKAARGCENWIPYQVTPDLPSFLKERARPLVALEVTQSAVSLYNWQSPESFDLVLGNEAFGISENMLDLADQIVYIPMAGHKRSMNLTHALACLVSWVTGMKATD